MANHLNDVSKKDPALAIDTLERWRETRRQQPSEMDYIIRHATRSLTKRGSPRAVQLLKR